MLFIINIKFNKILTILFILSIFMCLSCISAADDNNLSTEHKVISNDNSIISEVNTNTKQVNNDIYIEDSQKTENYDYTSSIKNDKTSDDDINPTTTDTTTQNASKTIEKDENNLKENDSPDVIYISNKGNDNNIGSRNNPMKTIKNALKKANNYDILYLTSGTYLEHGILINKNITIVGENPKTTIINAQNKHLFTIASNVRVSIKTLAIKNAFDENGGAIYNKGDLSIKHLRIYSNEAKNGGAIYNKGKLYMFKTLFTVNTAKYGSCIYNLNSLEANKCVFATNNAVQFAAIYSNAYMNLLSCNFTDNTNSSVFIEKSTKKSIIDSCLFENSKAVHGAAIYNKESPLEVKNTYFEKNIASNYGGAIYTTGTTTVNNSKFVNNKAGDGGAIASKNILTVTSTSFDGNKATNEGGAIYNSYDLSVKNSSFENNNAINGAAISSTSNVNKNLNIDSSRFLLNKAQLHGSAVYVTNKNQLVLKNSLISYNTNRSVYVRCDNGISNKIYNCNFTKNLGDTGSAIFNHKSVLSITKSTITKNNNTVKGAIYNNHGKTTINYCIIGENNKIDVSNYNGSVNADYNWWLKNSVNAQNANGFKINNWVYFKLDNQNYDVNKASTITARLNQVYNGQSFSNIDASKLPEITIDITVNGAGVSQSTEKTVHNGVLSTSVTFTKDGSATISAYTYNCKLTEDVLLKSSLINSKITSYFVQIGYSITRSIVNTWINVGITDVYVQTRVSTGDTANLRNVAALCKNTPIRVHAWVICFSGDDVSTSRQNEIRSFVRNVIKINGVNGVCLDYVRYSGLRPSIVNPSIITNFVKSVNTIIKDYDKNIQLSACVFAEKAGTKTYYGQDYLELSKYLDVMLPMIYKYEYNAGRSWLQSNTEYVVSHAKYCKVVSVLQSYDDNLNRLSKAELEGDAKAVMAGGSYGYSIFRYGLISSYPRSAINLS